MIDERDMLIDAPRLGMFSNIRVVDGDSLEGLYHGEMTRVRLYGIDAPELEQRDGPESASYLEFLVRDGRALTLEVISADQYGRLIGIVYPTTSNRGNSLNRRMVYEGHAYAFTRYGGSELGLIDAERDARDGKRGVWWRSSQGGERPWDFRRWKRTSGFNRNGIRDAAIGFVLILLLLLLMLFLFIDYFPL